MKPYTIEIDHSLVGQCVRQHRKLKQARAAMRRLIYCTDSMRLNRLFRWSREFARAEARRSVNFERLRLRIIEVACARSRSSTNSSATFFAASGAERNEYQTRAWQAENFLRAHKGWIEDMLKSRFGGRRNSTTWRASARGRRTLRSEVARETREPQPVIEGDEDVASGDSEVSTVMTTNRILLEGELVRVSSIHSLITIDPEVLERVAEFGRVRGIHGLSGSIERVPLLRPRSPRQF